MTRHFPTLSVWRGWLLGLAVGLVLSAFLGAAYFEVSRLRGLSGIYKERASHCAVNERSSRRFVGLMDAEIGEHRDDPDRNSKRLRLRGQAEKRAERLGCMRAQYEYAAAHPWEQLRSDHPDTGK